MHAQKKDPESNAEDWEKEIDLSYVEDEDLRAQVLDMVRQHSGLWDSVLGTI